MPLVGYHCCKTLWSDTVRSKVHLLPAPRDKRAWWLTKYLNIHWVEKLSTTAVLETDRCLKSHDWDTVITFQWKMCSLSKGQADYAVPSAHTVEELCYGWRMNKTKLEKLYSGHLYWQRQCNTQTLLGLCCSVGLGVNRQLLVSMYQSSPVLHEIMYIYDDVHLN